MRITDASSTLTPTWVAPLYVRIGYGSSETVDGPADALRYLSTRWPAERGRKYEAARALCIGAVERKGSKEDAREAFIAAALEAHILA